jgi:ethanolamine utilization microcompartment shell protein EutL
VLHARHAREKQGHSCRVGHQRKLRQEAGHQEAGFVMIALGGESPRAVHRHLQVLLHEPQADSAVLVYHLAQLLNHNTG